MGPNENDFVMLLDLNWSQSWKLNMLYELKSSETVRCGKEQHDSRQSRTRTVPSPDIRDPCQFSRCRKMPAKEGVDSHDIPSPVCTLCVPCQIRYEVMCSVFSYQVM